jgi:hypothetical protein
MVPWRLMEGILKVHKPMDLIHKELPGQLPKPRPNHGFDIFVWPEFRNQLHMKSSHINIQVTLTWQKRLNLWPDYWGIHKENVSVQSTPYYIKFGQIHTYHWIHWILNNVGQPETHKFQIREIHNITSYNSPKRIPCSVIKPVVEIIKPFFCQELRCTIVEVGIKFMNHTLKSQNREQTCCKCWKNNYIQKEKYSISNKSKLYI